MSIPFHMDHHGDAAITAGLRQRGVDVITAYEDSAAEMEDDSLLARAYLDSCSRGHDAAFIATGKTSP